ncbi:MAG: UDP-N-acetylmuramoyl-L-alanine--D-glutamate ligase [Oscillospiraceae bacterium]|nr:UDP-N-acetylmuramoyl-L-alanine--D-glutamate ligase [Oscillospiraceae bacterium]
MRLREYTDSLRGRRIAVLGIGVSNLPLLRLLLDAGLDVTARDRRSADQLGDAARLLSGSGARLIPGEGYLDGLNEDVVFRTPGIMPRTPELEAAARHGAVITSEMEAFFEVCPCDIIAVTGSDGKTTTTTLIAELLRAEGKAVWLGGNIGSPLLCRSDDMSPDDFAVVELSSFQLITMKKSSHVAVVTNVAPNHLDIHRDMDEYADAKRNILLRQTPPCRAVLNLDNEITRSFAADARGETLFFSRLSRPERGVFLDAGIIRYTENGDFEDILGVSDIKLPGAHNIENYMAAIAATRGFVSRAAIERVARGFGGVEHRIELVRERGGVKYYNDSIASSPTRTAAGLRSFDGRVILIAGGKDKGVPFDGLAPEIVRCVKTLVLTGFAAEKIRAAVTGFSGYSGKPEIVMRADFADAVRAAAGAAAPGDTVLLSPACTSFDAFSNFEERGNYFKEIVNGLD